jgi:isocitrate dehydrogenase
MFEEIHGSAPDISDKNIAPLLSKLYSSGFDVIKTENLYEFDDIRGFSVGQGE